MNISLVVMFYIINNLAKKNQPSLTRIMYNSLNNYVNHLIKTYLQLVSSLICQKHILIQEAI